jgi:hypothetical protein
LNFDKKKTNQNMIDIDKESIYCEIFVSINVWFKDYLNW